MYSSIRTAIITLLTDSQKFNAVYGYEPLNLATFPCATVNAVSSQSSDLATGTLTAPTQLDTYTFTIRLYYGVTQPGTTTDNQARKTALDTILAKTDEVINLFGSNRSLNGACQKVQPVATRIFETQREQVVMVSEITVNVDVVVKRV